jgi:hypothetical protein
LLIVAPACAIVSGLPAVAPPKSGLTPSDSSWIQSARQRLLPTTPRELNSLRQAAVAAAEQLEAQLAELPDGARWRAAWQIEALAGQLNAKSPQLAKLQAIEAGLAIPPPPEVKGAQHVLRAALRSYLGAAALTPQSLKQFDKAITLLDEVRRGKVNLAPSETSVRESYQRLAATHRLDDLLESFRNEFSQPNYRMVLTDDYVGKRAARHIEAPLRFQQQAGRIHLTVQAQAKADTSAVLVPNADRAEIRVLTKGLIPARIQGSGGRIQVSAVSTQNLNATQTLYLGPDGIDTPGPQVCDCSRTALACLQLCLRIPIIKQIGERIASRIVAKQLPKHDPEIARKVERGLAERIGEEGYDIAFRLNGTFRKLYSDRLPRQADEPRLRISSDADGIYWSALYANYDEVGALVPPPVPASSLPFDMVLQLHQSAVQSWADSLGGAFIDEATYLNLLKEDIGLESPTVPAKRPARGAGVIRFAVQNPLRVKFDATGIELKLSLDGYVDGAGPFVAAPKTTTIRYQLAPGKSGLRLVRVAEDFSKDAKWSRVLDGFFPAEWNPVPQYANAAVGEKLMMRYLKIQDGWVIVGSSLSNPAGAAADAAGE